METWRAVVGYESEYEVSDMGRVRRNALARTQCHRRREGDLLLRFRVMDGYHYVSLSKLGRMRVHAVHHLVLEAFVGPRPLGLECRHLNGIRTDNSPSNLAWGTKRENYDDRAVHGTNRRGDENGNSTLTSERVMEARLSYAAGRSFAEIGDHYGVSKVAMRLAIIGRTWSHLPGACVSRGQATGPGSKRQPSR